MLLKNVELERGTPIPKKKISRFTFFEFDVVFVHFKSRQNTNTI